MPLNEVLSGGPKLDGRTANSCPHFGRIMFAGSCFRTYLDVAPISRTRVIARNLLYNVAEHNAQNVFESLQGHEPRWRQPDALRSPAGARSASENCWAVARAASCEQIACATNSFWPPAVLVHLNASSVALRTALARSAFDRPHQTDRA